VDYLTVTETARALGARSRTVHAWLHRGGGPFVGAVRTPGGRWRIPRVVVERVRVELGITDGVAGGGS
jgi:excisionase family DNA binding protein